MESLFELNAQPLGQGQMSTIFHARKRDDGEWVLLKIFNLPVLEQSQRALGKAANEAEALSLIPPHPNIVRLHAIVCAPTECALTVDSAADDLLSLLDVYGGFLPEDHARPSCDRSSSLSPTSTLTGGRTATSNLSTSLSCGVAAAAAALQTG